jgi:hypothetical protein
LEAGKHLKWVTLGFTLVNFALSLFLIFDKGAASASGFFLSKTCRGFARSTRIITSALTEFRCGWCFDDVYNADCRSFDVARGRKTSDGFLRFLLLLESAMIGVFCFARFAGFLSVF